jgi:peptidyl-tRNA hydrolase, PTH1 family
MKIIVGLGNPGAKYSRTRHNAGFMAVDELAKGLNIDVRKEAHQALAGAGRLDDERLLLVKPQTFMNDSGSSVAAVLKAHYASPRELIVIHDELDLVFSSVRVKKDGGHGGHNGLRSIIERLGTADFIRVRIGIGRPAPGEDTADYVLSPFPADEKKSLPDALQRAVEAVRTVVLEGAAKAMTVYNGNRKESNGF